jgi:hypothetical protein
MEKLIGRDFERANRKDWKTGIMMEKATEMEIVKEKMKGKNLATYLDFWREKLKGKMMETN